MDFFTADTFRWLFGALFVVVGWILRSIYTDVKDLTKEVDKVKLDYVQKVDYREDLKDIKAGLVRIELKIDAKHV
jgi:hypothetical protein